MLTQYIHRYPPALLFSIIFDVDVFCSEGFWPRSVGMVLPVN